MTQSTAQDEWTLRKMFTEEKILERAEKGEIDVLVKEERHPARPLANEPFCTKSQLLGYYDKPFSELIATAHRYLRTDGSIGLSGKPDPKSVLHKGRQYHLKLS
jgi:hypothetical protein